MQPDFKRQLTLHESPSTGWQLQLWHSVHVTAGGHVSAELVRTTQLPPCADYWLGEDASSPCGRFCWLYASRPLSFARGFLWAADREEAVPFPSAQAPCLDFLSFEWRQGPGATQLTSFRRSTASLEEQDDINTQDLLQVGVVTTEGTWLAESVKLHRGRDTRLEYKASPSGAYMAVPLHDGLAVLALADCSTLLQLAWPFEPALVCETEVDRRGSLWWSPCCNWAYIGSFFHSEHHICCIQSRCWLAMRQAVPSHDPARETVLGWGCHGLLVKRTTARWYDSFSVVRHAPLAQAPRSQAGVADQVQLKDNVVRADFSPDSTWVALSTMRDGDSDAWEVLSCVQIVRCRTGCVAAEWRPALQQHEDPPDLCWARAGNRLVCLCAWDSYEEVLLDFEG